VIPSGPAALLEGSFLSCIWISSRVGRMLSCGSGMCESEGWGASKSACTRMASSSSQGEDGVLVDRGQGHIYIGGIHMYQVQGLDNQFFFFLVAEFVQKQQFGVVWVQVFLFPCGYGVLEFLYFESQTCGCGRGVWRCLFGVVRCF